MDFFEFGAWVGPVAEVIYVTWTVLSSRLQARM
jgi:hypothetical protein